jgi:hypothetical protein
MKYTVILSAIALVVLAVPTLGAPAKVGVEDGLGGPNGGVFTITVVQGPLSYTGDSGLVSIPVGSQFETFCIERKEYFTPGHEYWADVRPAAYEGGVPGGSDPLDERTAILYNTWRGLAGHTASINNQYQLAMWYQEGEVVWDSGLGKWVDAAVPQIELNSVYQGFGDSTALDTFITTTVGGSSGFGDVRVMTLWESYDPLTGDFSGNHQDLLVAPVPAAVLLGMLGLTAAGVKLRRFV